MLAIWTSCEHFWELLIILQWQIVVTVVLVDWRQPGCFVVPINPSLEFGKWFLCLCRCWSSSSVDHSLLWCKHWICHPTCKIRTFQATRFSHVCRLTLSSIVIQFSSFFPQMVMPSAPLCIILIMSFFVVLEAPNLHAFSLKVMYHCRLARCSFYCFNCQCCSNILGGMHMELVMALPNPRIYLNAIYCGHSGWILGPCLDMPLGRGVGYLPYNLVILPQTSVCGYHTGAVLPPWGALLELLPSLHCSLSYG